MSKKKYYDAQGNETYLAKLCHLEPEWAASRLRVTEEQRDALADALEAINAVVVLDNDRVARVDALAVEFYRETGLMAPGKSMPLEMCNAPPSDEERHEAYRKWYLNRLNAAGVLMFAALKKAGR